MKNFKVYNIKKKGLSFVLTFTMIGSVAVGLSGCSNTIDIDTESIVSDIHEAGSIESDIIHYIEISEKLNKLELSNYTLDEEIDMELDYLQNIQYYIDNFDSKNITCLRYLKMQEELVNKYIFDVGYVVARENSVEATKKYAAEFYGIDNVNDITFRYNNPNEYNANQAPDGNVSMSYSFDYTTKTINVTDKYIRNGVKAMADTQTNSDPDKSDNNSYNEERNQRIKNAIIVAEYLNEEVEDKDLYNEKAAKKIKR